MTDIQRYDITPFLNHYDSGQYVTHKDHIKEMKAKDNEIERLKKVMVEVRDDLVARADLKGDECVDLSYSQWMALCEATE
jgi:hypothetical protein